MSRNDEQERPPPLPPHNLPIQLTSFIGRAKEIAEIKELLAPGGAVATGARLLTLTGPGGSGKTRLGLQSAVELLDRFLNGVFFINLAPLTDPNLVLQTIASVLGVPKQKGEVLRDSLTNYLRDKNLLLLFDNCEHLIDACAQVADHLLRTCPQLKILATSREALGIAGEMLYRVPSLSLPDADDMTPESLSQSEAARLFIDRAVALQSTFTVTKQIAPALAQICMRLDGIPLALELAAARVPVLSLEQIAEKLDDRFRLLTGGSRTALPRHQTLRAAIDWSYELLAPVERIIFHRLAVFAGGWTLEAAEAVCVGETIKAGQVLDPLSRLVSKSMVSRQEQEDAARYYFLETIRVYAQDKLQSSKEARQVQQRHLDFFLKFATETYTWTLGSYIGGTAVHPHIVQEHHAAELSNFRAALAWSLDGEAPEKALELAAALLWFWEMNNYHGEGNKWLRRALAVASGAAPQLRAYALLGASVTNQIQGNYEEAIAFGEESVALYRELGDTRGLAEALGVLARAWGDQGNQEQSIAINNQSVRLSREMGNDAAVSSALLGLAMAQQRQGDYEGSVLPLEEALAVAQKLRDELLITNVLGMVARVYRARGDFTQATLTYNRVMAYSWKIGSSIRLAFGLEFYAVLATLQKQSERAARLWGAAHALRESRGVPRPAAQTDYAEYEQDAQRQLDAEIYARLYAEGAAMPLEHAVEYAMTAPIPDVALTVDPAPLSDQVPKQKFGGLTSREREVAILVAQGKSNREIADRLVLSERTIEKHIGNILSKLNFHSRTQLAAWVLERDPLTN